MKKNNKKIALCCCDTLEELINLLQNKMMKCAKLNGACKTQTIDDISIHWQKVNEQLLKEEGKRIREERQMSPINFWGK